MTKLDVASVTPRELVRELVEHAPPEPWFARDDFDPTYGARELRAAAKAGWIDLEAHDDPACWRFRLTPKGRAMAAEQTP